MEILQGLYFNFFFTGSLIVALFCGFLAFFFLTIHEKTKAAAQMGYLFAAMSLFHSMYLIGNLYLEPVAAYHRTAAVVFAMIGATHMGQFFFRYPRVKKLGLARIILIIQYFLTILVLIYLTIAIGNNGMKFNFAGHTWAADADEQYKHVSYLILLYFLFFHGAAIWRLFGANSTEKKALSIILAGLFFSTLIPGIFNSLARAGLVTREAYQVATVLLNLFGFFLITIAFINNTRDKTTFMGKIVSVSLLSVLLILMGVAYNYSTVVENAYDRDRVNDTEIAVRNNETERTSYLISHDLKSQHSIILSGSDRQLNISEISPELNNTWLRNHFAVNGAEITSFTEEISRLEGMLTRYQQGYLDHLSEFISENGPATDTQMLVDEIDTLQPTLRYHRLKIVKLPEKNFNEAATDYLTDMKPALPAFTQAMLQYLNSSTDTPAQAKSELLKYIARAEIAGHRHYRKELVASDDNSHLFTGFMYVDQKTDTVYEAGFSYIEYREIIARSWVMFIIFLVAAFLIITVGFRFFFKGALIDPLNSLLSGLVEVNKGNLDIRIPVKVEDEIGFLSRSFNRMVRSIRGAKQKLQQYADELEDKVAERTRELSNTLNEVRELKKRQDGDYFLTSLLIKPLMANTVDSEKLNIDFLIRQKKSFSFRRWRTEIGGDINIAHSITLKGRKYAAVVNADAMGKSIQGAGGALVLGSVFQSIIERTRSSKAASDYYPERWLKNAFLELHRIFESFDGSMLMSMVIALVDEQTGLMYYMNAEHPFTILYRDGVASFIEKELAFRKLGIQGIEGDLSVSTMQLKPGDVIFLGSDGRDDLVMGENEKGQRIINEDEHQILSVIEKARGSLLTIYRRLLKIGELSDDLSLLRISYLEENHVNEIPRSDPADIKKYVNASRAEAKKGNTIKAIEVLEWALDEFSNSPDILKDLAKLYLRNKQYHKAADIADDYIVLRPDDADFLYFASYCNKMIRRYDTAVDLGERVRLRNPEFVKNLVNLADIYALKDELGRAEKMVQYAERISPDNPRLEKLRELIKSKIEKK